MAAPPLILNLPRSTTDHIVFVFLKPKGAEESGTWMEKSPGPPLRNAGPGFQASSETAANHTAPAPKGASDSDTSILPCVHPVDEHAR